MNSISWWCHPSLYRNHYSGIGGSCIRWLRNPTIQDSTGKEQLPQPLSQLAVLEMITGRSFTLHCRRSLAERDHRQKSKVAKALGESDRILGPMASTMGRQCALEWNDLAGCAMRATDWSVNGENCNMLKRIHLVASFRSGARFASCRSRWWTLTTWSSA